MNAGDYYSCINFRISGGPTGPRKLPVFIGGDASNPGTGCVKLNFIDKNKELKNVNFGVQTDCIIVSVSLAQRFAVDQLVPLGNVAVLHVTLYVLWIVVFIGCI